MATICPQPPCIRISLCNLGARGTFHMMGMMQPDPTLMLGAPCMTPVSMNQHYTKVHPTHPLRGFMIQQSTTAHTRRQCMAVLMALASQGTHLGFHREHLALCRGYQVWDRLMNA